MGVGFADWLWRRHRAHYAAALMVFCVVTLLGFLVIPSAVAACLYLGFTRQEAVYWTTAMAALDTIAVLAGCWLERGRLAPMLAWANGDFSDPQESWNSATSSPPEAARLGAEVATGLRCHAADK